MCKVILFVATTLGYLSTYAKGDFPKDYPRQFCSNRPIELFLGKETTTTIWRTSNLCITVIPNLQNIKVVIYPGGRINSEGDWMGQESMPMKSLITAELIKSEQRGENRKMHVLKVTNLEADVYLTFFTTLDGAILDSVAFLNYHKQQAFKLNLSTPAADGRITTNYIKKDDDSNFEIGYPDETISLMRSTLVPDSNHSIYFSC